jgi:Zinc-finger of the MIZ type in Nse subunit
MDTRTTTISYAKDHFVCPITTDVFFDPVAASPCGHLCERTALNRYLKQDNRCPLCKLEIKSITEITSVNRDIIEKIINDNKDWHAERYFSSELFRYEISKLKEILDSETRQTPSAAINREKTEAKIRVNRILSHLKSYPGLLNEIVFNTNLIFEICRIDGNAAFFETYPEILKYITSAGLNYIHKSGNSPLTWMAGLLNADQPCAFFDEEFINKITKEGLNTIDNVTADSACFWFVCKKNGIFNKNPKLILLIDSQGLNTIVHEPRGVRGTSTLYYLVKENLQLLEGNDHLKSLITYEGLLSLNENNKRKDPAEWTFLMPDELKKMLEQMIANNPKLSFLLAIFESVILKENYEQVINQIKLRTAAYLKNDDDDDATILNTNENNQEGDNNIEIDGDVTIFAFETSDLQAYSLFLQDNDNSNTTANYTPAHSHQP